MKKYLILISLLIVTLFQSETVQAASGIGTVNIWFGDSHTVGLATANHIPSKKTAAKVGAGYQWASTSGYSRIAGLLKKKKAAVIVCGFGVNDIADKNVSAKAAAKKYVHLYKKIHRRFPKTELYFLSINPVTDKYKSPYISSTQLNKKIKQFNAYMKKNVHKFDGKYINARAHIKYGSSADGLHYDTATYTRIYQYVTGQQP